MRLLSKRLVKISLALVSYLLGYWTCKINNVEESTLGLIDSIYKDAVVFSEVAFIENGGLKDPGQISLGQGPKVRLWDYFGPNFNCISKERVGRIGDGGKWLCGVRTILAHKSNCIVYSIGSKGEVSFEIGLMKKVPNCKIHIFDPTLTTKQIDMIHSSVPFSSLHEIGLGGFDGEVKMKNRVVLWTQKTKETFGVQKLSTLMTSLGHSWIDVLKIDIEGNEWKVFEHLFNEMRSIPATQIQIELHFSGDANEALTYFQKMKERGFRVFSVEPNYYGRTAENARLMVEYSFIQTDNDGKIFWTAQ